MAKIKLFVFPVLLGACIVVLSSSSYAKPEYTKSEKKACAFCHIDSKAKPKELTDAGTYYKEHNHSLEGYKKK
jgi:predicted small secreted protein